MDESSFQFLATVNLQAIAGQENGHGGKPWPGRCARVR
jgi:hypothetical protein